MPNVNKPMEPKKETVTHKVGDAIERAGEKLKDAGAEKLGNAVYRTGNKIEHSQDEKLDRKSEDLKKPQH